MHEFFRARLVYFGLLNLFGEKMHNEKQLVCSNKIDPAVLPDRYILI